MGVSTLAVSCTPRPVRVASVHDGQSDPATSLHVTGSVRYEYRTLTPQGYSATPSVSVARFVTVEALNAQGEVIARGETDRAGQYDLSVRVPAARIRAWASVKHGRHCDAQRQCEPTMHIDVTTDGQGQQPYAIEQAIESNQRADLLVTLAEPGSLGGAFHVLDTLVTGMLTVHQWSQRELPPFFVIWTHASGADWSYYRGERPRGSRRYALELMGGEAQRLNTTDADEHDIFIVLHEFGHFVFDQLSSDSSIGGHHPATVLTDPGVAFEEGRATWFACAVLGDSRYRDAVGIAPHGSLRQDDETEQLAPDALRGLGSQRTVEEILWDLSDGTLADRSTPLPDRDNDGVALGPAAVFRAMLPLRESDTLPSIITLSRHIVRQGLVSAPTMQRLFEHPVSHGLQLPPDGAPEPWPRTLLPGEIARAKCDGRTNPAPSGGRAHPVNGYDAVQTYRVVVTQRARLQATLAIRGSGGRGDHSDLDLELRDHRANLVRAASGLTATERLDEALEPGSYYLYVRDGGDGNSANFQLEYALTPR
ncbi:MAG: hypothetical protein Q8Q09_24710 [Deltaproteobacteria bacterium]|nr:hypothetical protein [Deltaproteobacteria bacterium]